MEIAYKINRHSKTARLIKKYKYLYLLSSVPLLVILIYNYLPALGVLIAFKDYSIRLGFMGIFTSPAAEQGGLYHFIRLFNSEVFYNVLSNTLLLSIYKIIFTFPLPIILAIFFNELKNIYFKKIVQTISYLPYFLSSVIVYGIVLSLLSPSTGLINSLITSMGGQSKYFIADPHWFRTILVSWDVWQQTGWNAIIYLAAITTINSELYEAAIIDGATRLKRILYITIPGIIPIMVLLLVFRIGAIMDAGFEQVYLLSSPATLSVADIIDTYVLRNSIFTGTGYSFAAAVGLFKSAVTVILVLFANRIARMFDVIAIY